MCEDRAHALGVGEEEREDRPRVKGACCLQHRVLKISLSFAYPAISNVDRTAANNASATNPSMFVAMPLTSDDSR